MPQSRIRRYVRHGTLPQLAVFEASARHLCLARAAEELHLAQPTVSAQIQKLSQTVGSPLFEQVGRRIRLTETGRRTYDHCREILGVLARLDDSLAELRDLDACELRLAANGAALRFVTRLVAEFSRDHPRVAVSLRFHNRADLLARLAEREDDLYLFAQPPDDLAIVRQSVLANPLVMVAHPADPLVRERALSLARIATAPFIMREPGSGTRAAVVALFERAGLAPDVRMELASDDAVRCAVAHGAGVAVLPSDAFASIEATAAVAMLDVAGFPLERHWHFAYPVGAQPSPAVQAFMRHARVSSLDRVAGQSKGAQNAAGIGAGP